MTSKTLGNVVPNENERERMFATLNGLRDRYNADGGGDRFGDPTYNEEDDTVELRWKDGGLPWVCAWTRASSDGSYRSVLVWRHPSYRNSRDEDFIYETSKR